MKPVLITVVCLIVAYSAISQQVPPNRMHSLTQPPLRGENDFRPKQFTAPLRWKPVADLSAPLKSLQRLSPGDSIKIGELNGSGQLQLPVNAKLVNRRVVNSKVTSYFFTIQNPEGSWLYLTATITPGGMRYSGTVLNKKYSDALVLQHKNERYQFSTIEQTDVVTD